MEKLQQALEKARANRAAGLTPQGAPYAMAGVPQGATLQGGGPTQAPPPETGATPTGWAPSGRGHADSGSWRALAQMHIDPQTIATNRVLVTGGNNGSAHYDILRTRLREEARRHSARRIAILSGAPGAGKSTTTANLGLSFGRLPFMRTMVFDFDLRQPSLHTLLGQSPASDMGAVISGETGFAGHMLRHGDNLAFGLNRGPVANSGALLQSTQLEDFLDAVQDSYAPDLMLFDMPPFLVADDAHGFLQQVDGVVLLVEAEVTSKAQVDLLEQKLSALTRVLGVVLNKCHFPDESDTAAYGYY
ncbi:CpsD/CapB family tyrosine-protein kinase (plasmid) [Thioclava sp. 'Guangxiensis']|uniref:CpsD/CapB family tyrosine-protein kinase n=1 Tax=Thioclava sp. 'Guangxiensis' TaxID=3149044 RepID=UPI0032C49644